MRGSITTTPTYNSEGGGLRTKDPARRRRGFGSEAADLSASQGGLRRCPGAGRQGGARPAARGQLRPGGARRDAPEDRRSGRLPPDPRSQHGAHHHAHRQDGGDRQGPRPGARGRRLHHEALLRPRVPQPGKGGAAPRRARSSRRAARGADRGRRPTGRLREAPGRRAGRGRAAHLRRVRDPRRVGAQPGAGVQPHDAAGARLGRRRLSRPAHDRRPHSPPPGEARARAEASRADPDRARRGVPLPRPMRPFRSLRNKIALLFFAITATAFGVLYFTVVTQPESNLEERRLHDLELVAGTAKPALEELLIGETPEPTINRRVRGVAEATDSRVTVFSWKEDPVGPQGDLRNLRFYSLTDSREQRLFPRNDALLRKALGTRRPQSGFDTFLGQDIGLVAQPLLLGGEPQRVALYSRDFEEVEETVAFIRGRVLLASLGALLIALAGGYLVARQLARRVKRVEVAAAGVARGDFKEPLPVDSEDELGQLTRTFNEMQAQLREVDVARKEFIATASHELRTPIFSLGGFVELLQDEDLDEETRREFLETMSEQVERLQKLSVDLLDLSRLDSGSVQLHPEPVDLSELARSVVHEFTPALADHATDLDVRLLEQGPEAVCDPERVAQIMRILLDNALRHTPAGTHVTVRADRSNGAAGFTVADAGPGLPDGSRAKVFERFYTGDAARGAGLGLAIARELAERMDGRLRVTSQPGGTAFTLELPAGGNGA